ncbi:MAG: FAD-dependent oxidoreductase [Gemmatimonadetes bacterium]|nr:FAD-dependent oxidoreductase [Gemmatimonadota bacterium]
MNVAVVGGGLAGLVAAYDLGRAGIRTTVFERDARLGGQIWSTCSNGFLIEHGAEGYATGRSAGHELCRELEITGRLVSQSTNMSFELRAGRLVPAPPGRAAELVGIQASRADLGRGITSLVGGMAELVDALRAALSRRSDLRPGTPVQRIEPQTTGWTIATAAGDALRADAVVLAIPAADASRLLAPLSREAADALGTFRVVSSVTVSLAFERSAVRHPLNGAGLVSTAGPEAEGFRACTFASSQFPGRAAPGHVLLRAFFRPGPPYPLEADDARWVDLALGILRPVLGIGGDPVGVWVARWPHAIPRYAPDHEARVLAAIRRVSRETAPLVLAGAAYRGAGVAGAIESARAAARRILLAAPA